MRPARAGEENRRKKSGVFPKVPTELLRSALFDGLYGTILLLLDRIKSRPDWLSRTTPRRPLLRPLPRSAAAAPSLTLTYPPPRSEGQHLAAPVPISATSLLSRLSITLREEVHLDLL